MKLLLLILLTLTTSLHASAPAWEKEWTTLLQKYAAPEGVRYQAWKSSKADLASLQTITDKIASAQPEKWSRDQQLAFYINAYNAWTIHLVLEKYPLKSIRDVAPLFGFFTRKSITVASEKISLNHLEKEIIIKKFQEPRIHTAINCASTSCPPLIKEAFTAANLDAKLTETFKDFVNNNPLGVRVEPAKKTVFISSIFKWYADDFKPAGGDIAYINRFRKEKLTPDLKVKYEEYDWSLNEAR